MGWVKGSAHDDDDVYYYIRWRLELEGETENTGKEEKEKKPELREGETSYLLGVATVSFFSRSHGQTFVVLVYY